MRRASLSRLFAASAIAAFAAGATAPAIAQQSITPPAASEAQGVDQTRVEAFAEAYLAVRDVVDRWNPRIRDAEDQQQAEQLRTQATREMTQAIVASGLEVQTYQQIAEAAQANPDLAQRIDRAARELQ